MKIDSTTNAHIGMLLWALIVGTSFPAVGLLSHGLPPLLLTAMRFMIGALAMLPMIWHRKDRRPHLSGILLYAILGLCLAAFFGAMFWAAHRVTGLTMAALSVSVPVLAYAFGRLWGVEPPAPRLLAIFALGTFGSVVLALAQNNGGDVQIRFGWDEAVFFLGCFSLALYTVLSKWGLGRHILSPSSVVRAFWSLVAGAFLIAAAGLFLEPLALLSRLELRDVLLLSYLGACSTGATFWLLQRGAGALTPGTVTAYNYLVPCISLLATVLLRPVVIGFEWVPGSLLVITAIALLFHNTASRSDVPTQSR
ncbi:DMT family transporter [Kordiimonas marina]|uniref:DMT family transporter n=1 Tax=Kordiimonas marina TaxID=2872312 RepID=UPI001FF51140|nr:DMT family transporter [Kordiimonas marina]MCJ9428059.1 DMT family transporter [Kordiimonas marina]